MAPQIDPGRLLQDLRTLRSFGACGNGATYAPSNDVTGHAGTNYRCAIQSASHARANIHPHNLLFE